MGMFDTVFAALDCPFCGQQYRYKPLTFEQAAQEIRQNKQWQIESRQKHLQGEKQGLNLQEFWAERDGFDDIDAWIEQLDAPAHIEAHRTRPSLGLAEIQTKEFERVLEKFFVGDEVPKYFGHYFISASFKCKRCSIPEEDVYVNVWLEIEARKLKAVLTHDPETGEPARQRIQRNPLKPRPPDPHPPLHFKHRGLHAHARYNIETEKYDLEVISFPERFRFSHHEEGRLRAVFQDFAEDYLSLLERVKEKE